MKKFNYIVLFTAVFIVLSTSCSSSKSSKGGGWYQNRNVNHLKVEEQESIVFEAEDYYFESRSQME